jgi:hypothetical protein
MMIETGVLNKKLQFSDYADTRFSDKSSTENTVEIRSSSRFGPSSRSHSNITPGEAHVS